MLSNENLLGNYYPFFLNNANLVESHYLYQVYSPGFSKEFIPYVSLTKVSESTLSHPETPFGADVDLFSLCANKKVSSEEVATIIKEMLKKDEEKVVTVLDEGKLPALEVKENNLDIKLLITGLRDMLRWKNYRFTVGRFIDILWTPTDFIVFEICGDKTKMWLEPRVAYRNTDTALANPLKVDLKGINLPYRWEKAQGEASKMNRYIKNCEWNSFNRKPFIEQN